MSIKQLIDSYQEEGKNSIEKQSIFEINGLFSTDLFDEGFKYERFICEDVKGFCRARGFELDSIRVVSYFYTDLNNPKHGLKLSSDHYLKVIERDDGKVEAVVFLGSSSIVE